MITKYTTIIFGFAGIVIIILVSSIYFIFFKASKKNPLQTSLPTLIPTQKSIDSRVEKPVPQDINCDFSGQKSEYSDNKVAQNTANDGPAYSESQEVKIIARLLKKNPLMLEILDTDPWSSFVDESLSITSLNVRKDAIDVLQKLTFGEIFEAKEYQFLTAGVELGMGVGIYDIKPLTSNPVFYHPDVTRFPTANRSGLLLKYYSLDFGKISIFRDGKFYYKDKFNNTQTGQMNPTDLNQMFKALNDATFNELKSDDTNTYSPAVTLICKRYQNVTIGGNETILKPFISRMDNFLKTLQEQFKINIKYNQKIPVTIIDWPNEIPKIADIPRYKEEALSIFRNTGKVQTNLPIYTKTPDVILKSLSGLINTIDKGPFFRSQGKLYIVTEGTCMTGVDVCKKGTLYSLQIIEINNDQKISKALYAWPNNISVQLKDIQPEGLSISKETYVANQTFFDLIALEEKNFVEDSFIYRGVKMYKSAEQQSTSSSVTKPYLMKIYSKSNVYNWTGSKPITDFFGMIRANKNKTGTDDPRFAELKTIIPLQINELTNNSIHVYLKENDKYFLISSIFGVDDVTLFIGDLPQAKYEDRTGYKIWTDSEISLAAVPAEGVRISQKQYDDNLMYLQFREDKYYIEGEYVYILQLTNEP